MERSKEEKLLGVGGWGEFILNSDYPTSDFAPNQ